MITSDQVKDILIPVSARACQRMNEFARNVLKTRGGRIESGMGSLIEALWGFYANYELNQSGEPSNQCEIAWMYGHEYNDFACILRDQQWNPENKQGELLRVEAKSMLKTADEPKAHFDRLISQIGEHELLLVIVWDWVSINDGSLKVCPQVLDHFIGLAHPIAELRDKLHLARGGSFVESGKCPDQCSTSPCSHVGEPLNKQKKRERATGPEASRVSKNVSYAANFGGMLRMLKTSSEQSRRIFREIRKQNKTAHQYVSVIYKNFPEEEANQYTISEWQVLASRIGIAYKNLKKEKLIQQIRDKNLSYQNDLRNI